jgi:uncharacterized protein (DUF2132 family)
MISYSPPKSQIWGHAVRRLPAEQIAERVLQFLEMECNVQRAAAGEFHLTWKPSARLTEIEKEIDQTLGGTDSSTLADAETLPAVARWFDQLASLRKSKDVVAQASLLWIISWRDEPVETNPLNAAGGMFGIHLGQSQAITTRFRFRTVEQYLRIKASLAHVGLVELSDKHLRPKGVLDGSTKK